MKSPVQGDFIAKQTIHTKTIEEVCIHGTTIP